MMELAWSRIAEYNTLGNRHVYHVPRTPLRVACLRRIKCGRLI